jgi:hypothetical protein
MILCSQLHCLVKNLQLSLPLLGIRFYLTEKSPFPSFYLTVDAACMNSDVSLSHVFLFQFCCSRKTFHKPSVIRVSVTVYRPNVAV